MTTWSKTPPSEPGWYQVRRAPAFYTIAFLHSDGKWSWSGDRKPAPKKVSAEMIDGCEFARIPSPEAIEAAKDALREAAYIAERTDGGERLAACYRAAFAKLEGR